MESQRQDFLQRMNDTYTKSQYYRIQNQLELDFTSEILSISNLINNSIMIQLRLELYKEVLSSDSLNKIIELEDLTQYSQEIWNVLKKYFQRKEEQKKYVDYSIRLQEIQEKIPPKEHFETPDFPLELIKQIQGIQNDCIPHNLKQEIEEHSGSLHFQIMKEDVDSLEPHLQKKIIEKIPPKQYYETPNFPHEQIKHINISENNIIHHALQSNSEKDSGSLPLIMIADYSSIKSTQRVEKGDSFLKYTQEIKSVCDIREDDPSECLMERNSKNIEQQNSTVTRNDKQIFINDQKKNQLDFNDSYNVLEQQQQQINSQHIEQSIPFLPKEVQQFEFIKENQIIVTEKIDNDPKNNSSVNQQCLNDPLQSEQIETSPKKLQKQIPSQPKEHLQFELISEQQISKFKNSLEGNIDSYKNHKTQEDNKNYNDSNNSYQLTNYLQKTENQASFLIQLKCQIDQINTSSSQMIQEFQQYLIRLLNSKGLIQSSNNFLQILNMFQSIKPISEINEELIGSLEQFDFSRKQEKDILKQFQEFFLKIQENKIAIYNLEEQMKKETLSLAKPSNQTKCQQILEYMLNLDKQNYNLLDQTLKQDLQNFLMQSFEMNFFNEIKFLDVIENFEFSKKKEKMIISEIKEYFKEKAIQNDTKVLKQKQLEEIISKIIQSERNKFENCIAIFKTIELDEEKRIDLNILIATQLINDQFSFEEIKKFINLPNSQKCKVFDLSQQWFMQTSNFPENKKIFIIQLCKTYFEKKNEEINQQKIIQLIKNLEINNVEKVKSIFSILDFSNEQSLCLINLWKQHSGNAQNNWTSQQLNKLKNGILSQIQDENIKKKLKDNKVKLIINLVDSKCEEDQNILKDIYQELKLSLQSVRVIQQLKKNVFSNSIIEDKYLKSTPTKPIIKQVDPTILIKRKGQLSEQFTFVYQKEDFCLDSSTLKVICDFNSIKQFISKIKQKNIITIGFYGDFRIALKIIDEFYDSSKLKNISPQFDRIIAYTDGSIMFIIVEENKGANDSDVFINEEGYLFIRYLYDSCQILVICLNEKLIKMWEKDTPFQKLIVGVPPEIFLDKTTYVLKKINVKQNLQNNSYQISLSDDMSPCIIRKKNINEFLVNPNYYSNYQNILQDLKHQIQRLQNMGNSDQINIDFRIIQDQQSKIENIFYQNLEMQQDIKQLFNSFKNSLIQIQEKQYLQEFLHQEVIYSSEVEKIFLEQFLTPNVICECLLFNIKIYSIVCYKCKSLKTVIEQIIKKFEDQKQTVIQRKENVREYQRYKNMTRKQLINNSVNVITDRFYFGNTQFSNEFFKQLKILSKDIINIEKQHIVKELQFYTQLENSIISYIHDKTIKQLQREDEKIEQLSKLIDIQCKQFLESITNIYNKYITLREVRQVISPIQIQYDVHKKQCYLSMNMKIDELSLPNNIHKITQYLYFDEQTDYLVANNENEPNQEKHQTFIYCINKKKAVSSFCIVLQTQGIDTFLCINQESRQWAIFSNDAKKNSIGKISKDYNFEEGNLSLNVYTKQIKRVDWAIIWNTKNNVIILFEAAKSQFYELFLNGKLKELNITLNREIMEEEKMVLKDQDSEIIGVIKKILNNQSNDTYFFETKTHIYVTNLNYTIKNSIPLKSDYISFKIIQIDINILLFIQNIDSFECYCVSGIDEIDSKITENILQGQKKQVGNIIIENIVKSMDHYGQNSVEINCPENIYQLFYFENSQKGQEQMIPNRIEQYLKQAMKKRNVQFSIIHSQKYSFCDIKLLLIEIQQLLLSIKPIAKNDLEFILLTRIPLQLTTIQQANYIPLKDGLFKSDIMRVQVEDDQIQKIKEQITLGWIESALTENKKKCMWLQCVGSSRLARVLN